MRALERLLLVIFLSASGLAAALPTAAADELPSLMPLDSEIALAESAGPSHLAKNATIYALKRGGFEIARETTTTNKPFEFLCAALLSARITTCLLTQTLAVKVPQSFTASSKPQNWVASNLTLELAPKSRIPAGQTL